MGAAWRFIRLAAVAAILMAAGAAMAQSGAAFVDNRDGKRYRTVNIGHLTWMAENLNYNAASSGCYENRAANCEKYGRLYDWSAAKEACPAGWHLPSDEEWTALTDFVGDRNTAGGKLKSTGGWRDNGNGTDGYGFSALPGGYGKSDGSFGDTGTNGFWWSAAEYDASSAWIRSMSFNFELTFRFNIAKSYMYSVRCVQE